ncbi:actin cortical patch SUR7/pH-response regulator pali [Stachybotrys elegans]|uniref:Actin cortical patch SUR7/pH-response regulator pali n=1 Tax=Stachybotrys elegans TaxID=80388 RepID=A0A8K0WKT5_9HYPO|nr:actin cortical patch SUR7/pH-response regulator pali [Stachybotrys elegans]
MLATFLTARLALIVPLILSTTSAILCALCLSAGRTPGFLEDFAIIRLNTSTIGHSLLDFVSSRDNDENAGNTSNNDNNPLNSISDAWNDVEQEVSNAFDSLANSVIDEAVDLLDIPEWYSLHVMTICEGLNGPDAGLNATQCSDLTSENRLDLVASLDHYLSLSPVQIDMDIADIGWLEDIQDAINLVNGILQGLFALYVLTIILIVLSIATNVIVSLAWTSMLMMVNLMGFTLATLSSVALSIIVTVALTRAINALNDIGGNVGIRGERGSSFLILTWIASSFMICATSFVLVYSRKKNKALEWVMARPNESIDSQEKDSSMNPQ